MTTFAVMNTKKDKQQLTPSQEEVFREKTHHYLMCFIESCPLREQCLHWLVGLYGDTMPYAQVSMNPRNPKVGGENCEKFRPNVRVILKKGMTHFYLDMPGRSPHLSQRSGAHCRCLPLSRLGWSPRLRRRGRRLAVVARYFTSRKDYEGE